MKKFLFVLVMIICPFLFTGQNMLDADDHSNSYISFSEMERNGSNFSFNVKESYEGEFEENPIGFMEKYFDVQGLLKKLKKERIDGFYVTFEHSRGNLNAQFNRHGNLQGNFHKCKNVLVPMTVMKELYKNHKGWIMEGNVHIAKGKKNAVDEEFYRIKMKKGDSTKKIIIPVDES